MKGYFITEKQMKDLHQRIELAYRRAETGHSTGVQNFNDLYRAINFEVCRWEDEIEKS